MSISFRGRPTGSAVRRVIARTLEGDRVWGGFEVWPARNGVVRYRLTVYPPGANARERREQRLWRAWPASGALAWLVEFSAFGALGPIGRAAATATALYATGWIFVALMTKRRARPRRLSALKMPAAGGVETIGPYDDMRRCLRRLETADDALRSCLISPAQHEAAWSVAWSDMVDGGAGPIRTDDRPPS